MIYEFSGGGVSFLKLKTRMSQILAICFIICIVLDVSSQDVPITRHTLSTFQSDFGGVAYFWWLRNKLTRTVVDGSNHRRQSRQSVAVGDVRAAFGINHWSWSRSESLESSVNSSRGTSMSLVSVFIRSISSSYSSERCLSATSRATFFALIRNNSLVVSS